MTLDTRHISNCSFYNLLLCLIKPLHWQHTLSQLSRSASFFLSLYLSLFFSISLSFSLPVSLSSCPLSLSATHLGLVIHDSWSRVSTFNLRCDKTAHIYKFSAESLPIWIDLTSFMCSMWNTQDPGTKGRPANRLNDDDSCQSNDKECVLELQMAGVENQKGSICNIKLHTACEPYQIKSLWCDK